MEGTAVPVWAMVTIGGPIIFGLAIAYALIRNRRRRRALAARRSNRN